MGKQTRVKQIRFDDVINFAIQSQINNMAPGTAGTDAVNKNQLDAVATLINNLEWLNSALDYVTDNTALPATENLGDRYILSHDGGAPNAAWDGASAGDVVEFDGSVWVATTPTVGTFIAADDELDRLYCWGGASWTPKQFENTTASTGLTKVVNDIQLDASAAGDGLNFATGTLSVDAADGTIVVDGTGVSVGTITSAKVSDFTEAAQDAVGTILTDSATIDFTYDDGANTITAIVIADSIDETHLKGLNDGGAGVAGQVVVSDGAGGFTYATDSSSTDARVSAASAVTTGNNSLAYTTPFTAQAPRATSVPQLFVNGTFVELGDAVTTEFAYFAEPGTPTTALAFNALTATCNLYWNGSTATYELDANDDIVIHYNY
jgi:hypothetical protein